MPVYTAGTDVKPSEIARQGLEEAKKKKIDVVIVDTAGRLQVILYRIGGVTMNNYIVIYLFLLESILLFWSSLPFLVKQIDKAMMDELKEVKKSLNPTEVLLVVDAMTGQEAAGIQKRIFTLCTKKKVFFYKNRMKNKTGHVYELTVN